MEETVVNNFDELWLLVKDELPSYNEIDDSTPEAKSVEIPPTKDEIPEYIGDAKQDLPKTKNIIKNKLLEIRKFAGSNKVENQYKVSKCVETFKMEFKEFENDLNQTLELAKKDIEAINHASSIESKSGDRSELRNYIASLPKETPDFVINRCWSAFDASPQRSENKCLKQHNQPINNINNKKSYLWDIRKFASWNGEEGKRQLNSLVELFKEKFPKCQDELNNALQSGKKDKASLDRAYKLGSSGKNKKELEDLLKSLPENTPKRVISKIKKQFETGTKTARRWQKERKLKKSGKALSTVKPRETQQQNTTLPNSPLVKRNGNKKLPNTPLHPNDIRSLKPSQKWTLIIDETGSNFDESALNSKAAKLGRFVGILIPNEGNPLKQLSTNWHAVDTDIKEIDKVFQSVLDAPVGVFGLDVKSLPMTIGERWMDGVALLVDWVLRLIPLDGTCEIDVLIEQRGLFNNTVSWDIVRRECLRKLALAYPRRALNINLKIETITKAGSPYNGYVDAIAFSWAGTTNASKTRMKLSQLRGTCLLESTNGSDARKMLNAWDAFSQGINLPTELWWELTHSPDGTTPTSLLHSFMNLVGQEARYKPALWERLLNEVNSRMSDSPVNLVYLADAVEWLQQFKPKDANILPALRLVWLTVKLAKANHFGEIESEWNEELASLGETLFDEAAPLVCHSALHLAVSATNRFDFDAATKAVKRWHDVSPAVPGLKYWGQLRSTFGQHAAFKDENDKALEYFKEALKAFARLSDPALAKRNSEQTACYLTIALTNSKNISDEEVRKSLESVIGTLPEAATSLAASSEDERYLQHLLTRWLVHRPNGNEDAKEAYLNASSNWETGKGHPWELIQIYRAILLRDKEPDKALELALDAANIAFSTNQGPTVRMIGTCCRIIATLWGEPWQESDKILNTLLEQLPAATDRINILREAGKSNITPIELLRTVLPFNFR